MGAGASKSEDKSAAAPAGEDARAVSVRDEALGMLLDGLFLYGMFVSAKYMYKVRAPLRLCMA